MDSTQLKFVLPRRIVDEDFIAHRGLGRPGGQLWLMAFSLFTSLLIAAGFGVVVVAASAASDPVVMVLDAIAAVVFGVLAVIAAFFGAIFNLFGS